MVNDLMSARTIASAAPLVAALLVAAAAGCDRIADANGTKTPGSAASSTHSALPKPQVSPNDVLAMVNTRPVSRQDVQVVLKNLKETFEANHQPWKRLNDDEMNELLEGLIAAELKAQDAVARGMEREPDVQQRHLLLARDFFSREWDRRQLDRAAVTDADVRAFYDQNERYFQEPEQIQVRQLVVSSEDQAKSALVKLLEGSVDFVTLADQIPSLRPDAAKGATVNKWVVRSQEKAARGLTDEQFRDYRDPILEQSAFAIDKPGGISSYVKGADNKYHIFQLVARKGGGKQPFSEVSETIRMILQRQAVGKATEELQAKAKIDRYRERLQDVQQP